MAEVYRAEQELAAGIFRPVALKVIRPEYTLSPDFREMFLDEARTACTLAHPNIVHIYEVGEWESQLFMVMELIPGETLAHVARALRERGERFSDAALLAIGIYTCSALEAVHALQLPGEGHLNLVHRDVSPHNLLLSAQGALKLIDFGIAKAATNRNLTSPGVTKGKAGYFSPEQAMGKLLDGRSDLFSLGVTLYKLACGRTPFDAHKTHQARNDALLNGRWEPLQAVAPGLPEGLYQVVERALQIKPEHRFPDARAMREALEQVAFDAGIHMGQSALLGYVDDEGEVPGVPPPDRRVPTPTPTPPQPPSMAGTVAARAPRRTEMRSRSYLQAKRTRVLLWTASTFSLLVIGLVVALTLAGPDAEPPVVPGEPVASVGAVGEGAQAEEAPTPSPAPSLPPAPEPPVAAPSAPEAPVPTLAETGVRHDGDDLVQVPPEQGPAPAEEPTKAEAPAEEPTAVRTAPPERVALAPTAPPAPSVTKASRPPRARFREGRKSKPKSSPVAAKVDEAFGDDDGIGPGRLRVGAVPEAVVAVNGEGWGNAPSDRSLPPGQYVVSFAGPNGQRGVCSATVKPDRTTVVVYQFDTGSCSKAE